MYIDRPCEGCDNASTASAGGSDQRRELGQLSVVDCGKHVPCQKSPRLKDLCYDLWMATPLCRYWLILPR